MASIEFYKLFAGHRAQHIHIHRRNTGERQVEKPRHRVDRGIVEMREGLSAGINSQRISGGCVRVQRHPAFDLNSRAFLLVNYKLDFPAH